MMSKGRQGRPHPWKRQRPDACNSNPAVPGELPKSRIRGEVASRREGLRQSGGHIITTCWQVQLQL
jgi:hypothetical protein